MIRRLETGLKRLSQYVYPRQRMPELPDITVYLEALADRVFGERLEKIRVRNPFLLRTFAPSPDECADRAVTGFRRIGKRICIGLEGDLWIVIHLMIAGRLQWKTTGAKVPGKIGLAAFDFSSGTLILTEAGSKRRASMHIVQGADALTEHDPGGKEPLDIGLEEFANQMTLRNRTLKRALADPSLLSGIGNAYSDEILHRARLSPVMRTESLSPDQMKQLFVATQEILFEWTDRLRDKARGDFPKKVTAFHEEMAVHGKYGQPCPVCGDPVQRIRYAENETNYCATCQNNGRVLADRSLSRLLKDDWPRSLADWESP